MDVVPFVVFFGILLALIGATVHFVREMRARKKWEKQNPHRRYDPDEPVGELKHCDDYHAGNFYW